MTEAEFDDRLKTLAEEDIYPLSCCYVTPANLDLILGVNGRLSVEERATIEGWIEEAQAYVSSHQSFNLVISRQEEKMDGEIVLENVVTLPQQPITQR